MISIAWIRYKIRTCSACENGPREKCMWPCAGVGVLKRAYATNEMVLTENFFLLIQIFHVLGIKAT